MNRTELRSLLEALADKLAARHVRGEVHLAGGAAMLLAYGSDLATGDADALFRPDGPMIDAIREIALEHHLPSTWLNNQASAYFSPHARPVQVVFDHPHLQVMVTPADHLLAMKVMASRSTRDHTDARRLLQILGWNNRAQIVDATTRYFPEEQLGARRRAFIDALLEQSSQR